MLSLRVLRRRLDRLGTLLGRPAPADRTLRTGFGRSIRSRSGNSWRTAAVDGSGGPAAPPSWVPALLHVSDEHRVPVLVELRYEREDPLAVEFTFHGPTGTLARWSFSRDLLLAGMCEIAGQGEVMIWPSEEDPDDTTLFLRLGLQERHALLAVRRAPVHHWLTRTLAAVPLGHEMAGIDWDEEQRRLLRTV